MRGPGRKPATDATLRMPPWWRPILSIQRSDRSVSAGESLRPRSTAITCGRLWPACAIESASAESLASRLATMAISWPCCANTRARAAPMPDDAPVISVTGLNSGMSQAPPPAAGKERRRGSARHASPSWLRLPGRDAMAYLDAPARRYPQQVRRPPDHILLEFRYTTVSIDHFPHHLDQTQAAILVERAVDQAGEMVEVDGIAISRDGGVNQRGGGRIVKGKPVFEQGVQFVALDARHVSIDGGDVNQQRGRREPVIVIREMRLLLGTAREIGKKLLERFEHAGSRTYRSRA